jgi:SNF2 family DNA or RNA helicase
MANLLADRLTEDGVPFVKFTGDTASGARDAAVAAFTDPNSDVVAFIATDAAAEGLNLGTCCSTLYEMEPASTPTRAAQRRNRIHRVDGTAKAYQVVQFVLAGTVEHGIVALSESRAEMADTILGETGGRARTPGTKTRTRRRRTVFEEALQEYAKTATPVRALPTGRRTKTSGGAAEAEESGQLMLL